MKKEWVAAGLLAVVCAGLPAAESLAALRTNGKITLDGKLDEAVWAQAPVWKKFTNSRSGKPATAATEIRFLYDNSAIYVGVRATLPPGTKLMPNDSNLYAGECVEVMLDPGATRNSYFHFMVNPNGAKMDEYREQGGFVGDIKWEAIWDAAAFQGKGFWSTELRIPYSSMDFPDGDSREWSFNAARCARGVAPDGRSEDSAVTPDGAFHVAGKFPVLNGFDLSFAPFSAWQITPPATEVARQGELLKLATSLNVANGISKAREIMVSVDIAGADRKESQRRNQRATIGGNGSETLRMEGFSFTKPGQFTQFVTLRDPVSKRVLKRRSFPLEVRFQALSIQLSDPCYKQAIFASMNLDKVRYQVKTALPAAELQGKKLRSGIRTLDGKVLAVQEVPAAPVVPFEFPAQPLPEARMQIFAELADASGAAAENVTLALRKLPHLKGEVWLDKDHTVVLDGKRIFPILQWTADNDFIEVSDVFLAWEPYRGARVMSPIFSHDSRMSKIRKGTSVSADDEAYIRRKVAAERDKEMTFCYLFCDEPEVFGDTVEAMEAMYKILSDEDPYHPALIGNDSAAGTVDFIATGDLNALHSYARIDRKKPFAKYGKIMTMMSAFHGVLNGRYQQQTALWNPLAFDYSNYAQVNVRVPRYLEMRNEFLHAIVLGARGIFLYNSLPEHYPEIGIGTVQAANEIKSYAEMLALPEKSGAFASREPALRSTVREKDGELLVIVGNLSEKKLSDAKFSVAGLQGRELSVMTEDRTVRPDQDAVTDVFAPWDVHVYRTGNPARLMSRTEIEKAIEDVNAKRVKPGNLAFQMFEGETVKVTASSNRGFNVRPDNALWHVADGVIEPDDFRRYNDQLVVWEDATPDAAPDWIALEFARPVTMGKVVIYPVENSLQDYEVQVLLDGSWKTLAKATDATGRPQVHTFPAVRASQLRIFITRTRTRTARIAEIEVYEK